MTTVTKHFHFYAAHRNEEIGGKCGNLHGHKYELSVEVSAPRNGSVTILFEELESIVRAVIVDLVDHALLLHRHDPAAQSLVESGACGKVFWAESPTSAENMAELFFWMLLGRGLTVVSLTLKETETSIVTVRA